jgi:short-subunit dehydrogenase
MAGRFEGKTALVTGASAGIGREVVRLLAGEGARVAALARSADRLRELSESLGGSTRVLPVAADVADAASMRRAADEVLSTWGVPDVVVANAGIGYDARFEDTSDEAMRRVLEINVLGVLRTVRPFVTGMVRRGSGRILFISSVVAKRGIPHYTAYSASKFALDGMAGALRAELQGSGVTVGVVYPSSTSTEFRKRVGRAGPPQSSFRLARHSPEKVARAIIRMARSRRREAVLSLEGKLMVVADALAPGIMDRVLHRVIGKRRDRPRSGS